MTTMRDVGALAGVSPITVSRVCNGEARVAPETRARVEAAIAELNYVPNTLASTFRSGRAQAIGVAVPDIVDPFFAAIASAAEKVAAQHDMLIMISTLGGQPERNVIGSLLGRRVSGLILASTLPDQGYLKTWLDQLPIVLVDRPPVGIRADHFVEDDFGGAVLATRHLIEHGHKRVAFTGDTTLLATTESRRRGYVSALESAGLTVDDDLIALGASDADGARSAVERFGSLDVPPTAVFSSNARCTMSLVAALGGRTWAVAGFGDFPMADVLSPGVTVIDQDPATLGRLAAERVVARLNNGARKFRRSTVLPVTLVERESCRIGL